MIEELQIRNFKSIRDLNLPLGRFTVLVGPNGCGKSSVLHAARYASEAPLEPAEWKELANKSEAAIEVVLCDQEGFLLEFRTPVTSNAVPQRRIVSQRDSKIWEQNPSEWRQIQASIPMNTEPIDRAVLQRFSTIYLHPQADRFQRPSRAPGNDSPNLDTNGDGLASVLSYIAGYDSESFTAIVKDLASVVPGVKRVRITTARVNVSEWEVQVLNERQIRSRVTREEPGHRFLIDFADGRRVRSELVSEGTAIALGLITLLHHPERPKLLLLDDLDRGLHIEAQARLMEVLRRIQERDPSVQILCTTHSPYLVSLFAPEEVRVLALDEHRCTRAQTLDAHPDFEKWRFGAQTGELWAALGHRWVAESP